MKLSSNLKILIVDDCLDARNLIKMTLRKKGFKRIESASNGIEALRVLEDSESNYEPVALILADWQMPESDGLNLLSNLKADSRFKNIPFIMITADNDKDHVEQAISYGLNNYIIKPIQADILFRKISETLSS